ncbi:UNVERIFIED_CONTAM: hypothetical protein Slati_3090200 [Sesamum latifolium]|uniref:Transposase n=1 Tax=Sesamum latifolium TaxID=2727402 RepID=A0AAW2UUY7_9LAMI
MRRNASLANYTPTSYHQPPEPLLLRWPHGRLMRGDLMSWGPSLLSHLPDTSTFAATDYFSKWLKQFHSKRLCAQFWLQATYNSSMLYNAVANGLAEAFNKTLCNLLNKGKCQSRRETGHEKIGEALWAYRTLHRTGTQATPYCPWSVLRLYFL